MEVIVSDDPKGPVGSVEKLMGCRRDMATVDVECDEPLFVC